MIQVTAEEAMAQLDGLLAAAINGESMFITQDGRNIIQLFPILPLMKGNRQAGSAKGLIHIADDFDAPLDDLKEYME